MHPSYYLRQKRQRAHQRKVWTATLLFSSITVFLAWHFLTVPAGTNRVASLTGPAFGEGVVTSQLEVETGAVLSSSSSSNSYAPVALDQLRTIDLPIIMYHYIEPIADPKDTLRVSLTTTPEDFEAQVKALSDGGFTFYTVSDVPALMSRQLEPAQKRVILSFDDGYRDFYEYAFPILKKYHARATLYVISDVLDQPAYLTKDQLKEIAANGLVEIGDHTRTHADLPTLSEKEQRSEILDSKATLEKLIGQRVLTFAYPYGHYNDTSVKIVSEAYIASVSVHHGRLETPANLQTLSRLHTDSLHGASLRLFLQGSGDN